MTLYSTSRKPKRRMEGNRCCPLQNCVTSCWWVVFVDRTNVVWHCGELFRSQGCHALGKIDADCVVRWCGWYPRSAAAAESSRSHQRFLRTCSTRHQATDSFNLDNSTRNSQALHGPLNAMLHLLRTALIRAFWHIEQLRSNRDSEYGGRVQVDQTFASISTPNVQKWMLSVHNFNFGRK